MSLQNPEHLATKQDLKDFYDRIRPYMGGLPEVVANKFSKGDLYSTDEKMIGQWYDEKPLYQKTVSCGALPDNASKTVIHGISNLENVCDLKGIASITTSSTYRPLPLVFNNSDASMNLAISVTGDSIILKTDKDRSMYDKSYVTIQYTKTTDSAISIGSDTDYSTEEKIIGTWIDNKPLYQKTVSGTTNNVIKQWKTIDTIPNISKVISYDGILIDGSGNCIRLGYQGTEFEALVDASQGYVYVDTSRTDFINKSVYLTIQYTKTTD